MAATPSADVIALINSEIVSNGANLITADVLAPVLVAMVEQINELVGDPSQIPDGEESIVSSLNKIVQDMPSGINILSGTDDPNDTPPPSFSIGDFYQQTSGGNTVAFYQYNGNKWAKQVTQEQSYLRPITSIASNYIVQDSDFTIVYSGVLNTDVIDIPLPADHPTRILNVVNKSNENINFTTNYIDTDGTSKSEIPSGKTVKIQSDGTNWIKIN